MGRIKGIYCLTVTAMLFVLSACGQPTVTESTEQSNTAETAAPTDGGEILYQEGTYQGSAMGNNSDVTVEVTFGSQEIISVTVVSHNETQGISDTPIERIPKEIVEGQTLAVDTVTGATNTSLAILEAVEQCVEQAGGDVEALKQASEQEEVPAQQIELTTDVLILGGGGAGVSAAISAAAEGSEVLVVEKTAALGGNTILSGGGYNAYDAARDLNMQISEQQLQTVDELLDKEPVNEEHEELIETVRKQLDEYRASASETLFDSVELHALQTYDAGDYLGDPELILTFCQRAADGVQWLEDYCGIVWQDELGTMVGGLWPRAHYVEGAKSGQGYFAAFTRTIEENELPVEFLMETRAQELLVEDGRIVGAKATGADGTEYTIRAESGVVLATGGFAANMEMCMKYKPELLPTLKNSNSAAMTGDGIVMAEAIGANLVDMDQIQCFPSSDAYNGSTSGGVGGTLYINKEGVRFVDESARRDVLTAAALEQTDGQFYVIADVNGAGIDENGLNSYGQKVEDLIAQGKVFEADTLGELAEQLELDPEVFTASVERWNEIVASGEDTDFGRVAFTDTAAVLEAPFYASFRSPAVHHTMGGVQVDAETRVMDTEGNVIPGLYAAGEVTGGFHGSNRVGGNAVPDAISNGRAAGLAAAQQR